LFLLLTIAGSGFDLPGLATMYLNLQQARSGDIQHLNFSRKAINPGWSENKK
jgi:hypothetical protein